MPRPGPAGEQRGEQLAIIVLRHRLVNEPDLALVQQTPVAVIGRDDDEFRAIEGDVPLDQRQGSFADRAEADHHDRALETGVQLRRSSGVIAFMSVDSKPEMKGSRRALALNRARRARRENGLIAGEARNQRGKIGARRGLAAGADQSRARRRARPMTTRGQAAGAARTVRAAITRRSSRLEKPKRAVVGRVADQQHGAMAAPLQPRAAPAARASSRCRACGSRDRPRADQAAAPADPGPPRRARAAPMPTTRRPSVATSDSSGSRPSRKRSEVLVKRTGP